MARGHGSTTGVVTKTGSRTTSMLKQASDKLGTHIDQDNVQVPPRRGEDETMAKKTSPCAETKAKSSLSLSHARFHLAHSRLAERLPTAHERQ